MKGGRRDTEKAIRKEAAKFGCECSFATSGTQKMQVTVSRSGKTRKVFVSTSSAGFRSSNNRLADVRRECLRLVGN